MAGATNCFAVQSCRKCRQQLENNHPFSVCQECILGEARRCDSRTNKRDPQIQSYSDLIGNTKHSYVRWQTFNQLKVRRRRS